MRVILFLLLPCLLSAGLLNFQKAEPGDYIVTQQKRNYSLLHIYDKRGDLLTIEEITIPEEKRHSLPLSWKEWVAKEAPHHTSWVIYKLDLQTGHIGEYYSFSRGGFLDPSSFENFLPTLLSLSFTPVADTQKRRIGSPPHAGQPDTRHHWRPPVVVDGKKITSVTFDIWETKWPNDESDLSGKRIEIYLPKNLENAPCYFPYWMQIHGNGGVVKVHVADSGKGMTSTRRTY